MIKTKSHPKRNIKFENMITEDEVQKIVDALTNPRDRAFKHTLYDSGGRIGELLTLTNKDVGFEEYGAMLFVIGKTGYRKVRIFWNFISYLREWQNSHSEQG